MYQSPIEIMMGDIHSKIIEHQEKMTINMIRDIGINADKDELVKALKYDRNQYSKGYSDAMKETRPRWIPVSERYPRTEDEYKDFLVTDDEGKVSVQEFYLSLEDEPQPYFSGMRNVIAWMPLPQPYREVTE